MCYSMRGRSSPLTRRADEDMSRGGLSAGQCCICVNPPAAAARAGREIGLEYRLGRKQHLVVSERRNAAPQAAVVTFRIAADECGLGEAADLPQPSIWGRSRRPRASAGTAW